MQIDISKYIGELLFQNPSVVIPGLGAFESKYKATSIDFVQGEILPPSSQLVFNESLSTDDGVLTAFLVKETGYNLGEVLSVLTKFISDIKTALDNKEMIAFATIGRIYKNFEDKIQFLPESTNFNTNMYGLPSVQYYPILRSKEQFIAKKEEEIKLAVVHKKTSKKFDSTKWIKAAMPYAAAAFLGFFFLKYALTDQKSEILGPKKEQVAIKLNKHAGFDAKAIDEAIAATEENLPSNTYNQGIGSIGSTSTVIEEDIEIDTESLDTESATPLFNQKEAIIIVHSFGSRKNVKRMVKKLSKLGFIPYSDKHKGITRVGIQFAYDDPDQIQHNLRILRKKVNKGSFYLKK